MDDTHAYMYILTDCEGGIPVSVPGVGGNKPLVTVDLGQQPTLVKCSPHLEVAVWPCVVRRSLINILLLYTVFNTHQCKGETNCSQHRGLDSLT